ncbi:uncharacterized protein N7529_009489 [Penicillium soppii]|uniref:uncharacterized protein n=1 Tax=Penicillium soppii TaxID=69789 RepID=UPI0025483411|nr:uncharacterized protein N7529_009489 [Penicillium soppii]KAJ5855545.1 hypothetical protein N7529_009489 [Penicillium soppii]
MDLLAALETIRNASDATLHSHAAQTILTIRTISQRLQSLDPGFHATPLDPGSVQSPPHSPQSSETTTSKEQAGGSGPKSPQPLQAAWSSDYHAFSGERPGVPSSPHSPQLFQAIERTALRDDVVLSSLQIPRAPSLEVALTVPTAQSTPDGEYSGSARPESSRTPPDHVSQLLKGVKKSAGLIWKVSRESPSALLSRKRSSDEDPRLDHIRCIEGDRSLGNKEKLLRVLALRSIALEFTKKEQDNGVSPTRRNALYEQTLLPVVPDSSRANVFNFGKKDFLSKSIAAGLKYMVFEEVIATHCHNLPSICAAISAIVALQIDQFRRLRYDEMHCFAQRLISDDECIELSNQKMHLLDLVRSLSPWFNQVQNDYNCESTSKIDFSYAVLMVLE